MEIAIRKFQEEDIPYKVKWINDDRNNKYLHYDLPLREDKTLQWFKTLEGRNDRIDYTITHAGEPAGLIGLLNIDLKGKEAEYYICLGGDKFKGKGIANIATDLLIQRAYKEFGLNTIYLYTEVDNVRAQKLFEKSGFVKEGILKNNLFYNGKYVNRYIFTLDVENYIHNVGVLKIGIK
ncbi:GNAT family N-acetyltransferase [Oceanobacillus bengalensis]|uniref:N-acetyltransferase n=1 Tax=Oceanobacillus bengalensis TaxID=1435466 RepID=A0A494YSL8_9BACI|nr:GNAT family protein [Oceanobacillus bengalensis]RKQ12965.1 N-acetyltransferase [Oceanobacillus bengalensis]